MRSIRKQLTAGLLAGLFFLIAICGGMLYAALKRSLTAEYDAGLLSKARALVSLTEQESDDKIAFDFADGFMPEFERPKEPEYFELWLEDGSVLERSHSLESRDLPKRAGTFEEPLFWDLPLPDGRRGRAVGIVFVPQRDIERDEREKEEPPSERGAGVTLVLARSREDLSRTLHLLTLGIGGVGLLLPAGIALIVVALVFRGLRPLDRIAGDAASIDSGNLQHRFPESEMPRELQPICRRLNDLLQRLEEAFTRERRFTGNAAHELRTPIAELRSLTEVASMHPDDPELCRKAVTEALAIACQMERLVTVLLALARAENSVEQVRLEPIDLGRLLQQAWAPFHQKASKRRLSINWKLSPSPAVVADPALVLAVLSELFSNAVIHSPEAGRITVETLRGDHSVRLLVANTNSSLDSEDLPHLFEPFWQKDLSRTDCARSGLGLSLVSTFCQLMNVNVSAALTADKELAIELAFPPHPSAMP